MTQIFNEKAMVFGKTGDKTYQAPRLDTSTHALETIEYPHHEIHAGSYYANISSFTLANGQVATFGITTHATKEMHLTWELSATADGTFDVIEGVTSFDSGGVAAASWNHNRNILTASVMACIKGQTGSNLIVFTGGTILFSQALSTGKGSSVNRSNVGEYILKTSSKYIFRYTNGTSANVVNLELEWYEHTPRTA